MRSRNLWLIALAAIAAIAIPAVAGAKPASSQLDVTKAKATGPDTATYEGTVSSKKSKCEKGRRMVVIHDSDPPFTIGETETDENGNWKLEGPYPQDANDDRIVVKLKKKKKGCKGDSFSFPFYD